jgi:hypothetical protein
MGGFQMMIGRMLRSARLDSSTFLSLKEDPTATGQALIVLALAGTCFAVGHGIAIGDDALGVLLWAILGAIGSLVLGFVWLSLTFLLGTKLFGGRSDYWSLARPVFFSTSPGLIFLMTVIPVYPVPEIARAIGIAWIAISSVVAVKTALGVDNMRSLLIFIIVTFTVVITLGLVFTF